MSPEAGRDQQQFSNYSLNNLRLVVNHNRLSKGEPWKTKENITTIVQTYLESESYRQTIDNLVTTANPVDANASKIEESFKTGLTRNLKAFNYYIRPISKYDQPTIATIINNFIAHCNETTTSFIESREGSNFIPSFHIIIRYPDLHNPNILKEILPQLDTNPFLRYAIVNQLFRAKHNDSKLNEIIAQKTKYFISAEKYNLEHQLGLTDTEIRKMVLYHSDPLTLIKKMIDKKQKETRPTQSKKVVAINLSPTKRSTPEAILSREQKSKKPTKIPDEVQRELIKHYLEYKHPLLNAKMLQSYLEMYPNDYETKIQESISLYEKLRQEHQGDKTSGLELAIMEVIRRQYSDADLSVNNFIKTMQNPEIRKYNILGGTIIMVILKYIDGETVNLNMLTKELERESKQWQ